MIESIIQEDFEMQQNIQEVLQTKKSKRLRFLQKKFRGFCAIKPLFKPTGELYAVSGYVKVVK